jgi:hypothetical protein
MNINKIYFMKYKSIKYEIYVIDVHLLVCFKYGTNSGYKFAYL